MMVLKEDWLTNPPTVAVTDMLETAGYAALFVGGCVRNALLGAPVSDLDISTDALPGQVMDLAKNAGLKVIPTGFDHGTVTIVAGGIPHEVTTFRKDIETDGRRAVVAYSNDILDDAKRRDFTMNALYADSRGQVLDPLNGMPDLIAGHVRFIENANNRIKEDYLRSLRFFRFHAWYGNPENGMDAVGLAAIAANLAGLDTLSKERIGHEMLKLLAAPDPGPAVASMEHAGVLARILPGSTSRALPILVDAEVGDLPNALRRLAALGGSDVGRNLRLGRADTRYLKELRNGMQSTASVAELAYRHGEDAAIDSALLRAAVFESTVSENFRESAKNGSTAKFPVAAKDLMPELSGPALGKKLAEIENRWIHSNFELTRSQLLA